MAKVGNLLTKLSLDSADFQQGMRKAGKTTDAFRGISMRLKGAMVAVGAAMVAVGVKATQAAARYEKSKLVFEAYLGSAQAATQMLQKLEKFSVKTPFETQEVEKAAETLLGFGVEAGKLLPTIRMLGDVSKGNNEAFQRMAVTFGQARAEGKVMSKDLREFINQGVPIVKLLSDSLGVAEGAIFDMASRGKISFGVLEDAFSNATGEGGIFFEMMDKQSQTFEGKLSTLKGQVDIFFRKIGEHLLPALSEAMDLLMTRMDQVLAWFDEFNANGQIADQVTGVVYALDEAFSSFFRNLRNNSGLIRGLFALVQGDIEGAKRAFKDFAKSFEVLSGKGGFNSIQRAFHMGRNRSFDQQSAVGGMLGGGNLSSPRVGVSAPGLLPTVSTNPVVGGGGGGGGGQIESAVNIGEELAILQSLTNLPAVLGQVTPQITTTLDILKEKFSEAMDGIVPDVEHFDGVLKGLRDTAQEMAESVGGAMMAMAQSGETSFRKLGQAALMAAAKVVRAKLMEAVAAQIANVMKAVPFPFNVVAAPVAAAVVGTLFNGMVSKIAGTTKFAKGGIVNKPTMGLVGEYPSAPSDPEVIGRASTIANVVSKFMGQGGGQELTMRVSGSDFIFGLREASFNEQANGRQGIVFTS